MSSAMQPSMGASHPMIESGRRPFLYVIGGSGTAVIDLSARQLVAVAAGITPGPTGLLIDNHYRDRSGRLWTVTSANQPPMPWDTPNTGSVAIWDPLSFRNDSTIRLGHNVVNTPGLTPDGKLAVIPITTENKLNVYDTQSFAQVATVPVGVHPWDMMISPDGKYCCEPDVESDTLTIVDTATWKVIGTVPIGADTAPFMVTTSPNSKIASVQGCGSHGGLYNGAVGPPAKPTGKGYTNTYVDLASRSVIKSFPLDFLAIWDEFTPDGKYDFIFGPLAAKTVVVDVAKYEVAATIPLQSPPDYITPDPSGRYVYASVKAGIQVIDPAALKVIDTIPTGGIVGTPLVLRS